MRVTHSGINTPGSSRGSCSCLKWHCKRSHTKSMIVSLGTFRAWAGQKEVRSTGQVLEQDTEILIHSSVPRFLSCSSFLCFMATIRWMAFLSHALWCAIWLWAPKKHADQEWTRIPKLNSSNLFLVQVHYLTLFSLWPPNGLSNTSHLNSLHTDVPTLCLGSTVILHVHLSREGPLLTDLSYPV